MTRFSFSKSAIITVIFLLTIVDTGSVSSWNDVFRFSRTSTVPLRKWNNNLYYLGSHFVLDWFQAVSFCNQIDMKLAAIKSAEENEAIYKFIRESGHGFDYWIGGTKLIDNQKWIWFPYAEDIDYTNWQPGQPDFPNTEKCLQVWKVGEQLMWNDRTCTEKMMFICKREKSEEASIPIL